MVGWPVTLWRSARLAVQLAIAVLVCLYVAAAEHFARRPAWVPDVVRWWYARTCRVLDLRLEVSGRPHPSALLVVNHISWLDILVIGAQGRIGFLAKDEIRHWPLIGWLAATVGTHFIRRGAARMDELREALAERIRAGQAIAVFPEGTTSDGAGVMRFHPRLFAVGQQPGVLVQPVALRYGNGCEPDPVAPFVGTDTFAAHLGRVLRHPGLSAQVHFLATLDPDLPSRRDLADAARLAITRGLGSEAKTDPVSPPHASLRQAGPDGSRIVSTQTRSATQ